MVDLDPFVTYFDHSKGPMLPLPETLSMLYGKLRFPSQEDRPFVFCNFVSTLDGVISLNVPGFLGGGYISGFNKHDQMLMGILRACADAVIVGTSQLHGLPGTIWTSEQIFPELESEYAILRSALGKRSQPLQVVVTSKGDIDLSLPIFQSKDAPVLILTNEQTAGLLKAKNLPSHLQIAGVEKSGRLTAGGIIDATSRAVPGRYRLFLIEGGPHLLRYFLEERCLDELFLTLAPQVAGRDPTVDRPGFIAGKMLAPFNPTWGELISLKQAGNHLFLRYRFDTQ